MPIPPTPNTAGISLDGMIATEVFGATLVPVADGWAMKMPDNKLPIRIPRYSDSWDGAGLVVEEMRRRGWQGQIWIDENRKLCVSFWKPSHNRSESFTESNGQIGVSAAVAAILAVRAERGEVTAQK